METNFPYEDILYLQRPKSIHHGPMSMVERGAQFSPFAALRGYEELLEDSQWEDAREPNLVEEGILELDRKLQILHKEEKRHPEAIFHYIHYEIELLRREEREVQGFVKRIISERNCILLTDGRDLPISQIVSLEITGKYEEE